MRSEEDALTRLNELVGNVGWGYLPVARDCIAGNTGSNWEVRITAVRLAAVVGAVREYWAKAGEVVDENRVAALRDYVYRGRWDPRAVVGGRAVEELLVVVSGEKEEPDITDCLKSRRPRFSWTIPDRLVINGRNSRGREVLASIVSEFDERLVLSALTHLGNKFGLIMILNSLGILESGARVGELAVKIGVERSSLPEVLLSSAEELRAIIETGDGNLLSKSDSFCCLVDMVEKTAVAKSGGKSLTEGSVRMLFVSAVDGLEKAELEKRWQMLSQAEKKVAVMAIERGADGNFVYSEIQIANSLGINDSRVNRCLGGVTEIMTGKVSRYVGSDGQPILQGKYPAPIIDLLKADGGKGRLEKLEPLEQEICRFVANTDARGLYPTYSDIEERFGTMSKNLPLYIKNMVGKMRRLVRDGVK